MKPFPLLRRSAVLLLSVLLLAFTACEQEKPTRPSEEPEFETFVECLFTEDVTMSDLVKGVMAQYGVTDEMLGAYREQIDAVLSLNIRYRVHAITYRTVTPDGQPTVASGVIYYPFFRRPAGVIEISPINRSKRTCGTEDHFMVEVLPGMVKGYICIVPDLIGCGSTAELPISYLQHENVATVSADMRKAAEEFVYSRYQRRLSSRSILFGYSLGGSGILSLACHYDRHPECGVTVEDVFAGGGAYEPLQVIRQQILLDRSDYAVVPNILLSMMYYDRLDLDPDRIFIGPLREHYREWCDGYMPVTDLTKLLGTHPSGYLSPDFIREFETAEEYAPLMEALLKKNLPSDWKPKARIHLFHAAEDHYVSTVCGDRLYEHLKVTGADVSYKKYDTDHVYGGVLIGIDFMKFLL